MGSLYRVDSSIQGATSVTREIIDEFERGWTEAGGGSVLTRDLVQTPVTPAAWEHALRGREGRPPTAEQAEALALVTDLADEMVAADVIVVGAPLYNWGPSPHVNCWINLLWTDPRFAPRSYPLRGKPIVLVTARGGDGTAGSARDGWDNSAPYVQHTFGPDVFGGDVTVIETPLTLADRVPQMADQSDRAARIRSRSRDLARSRGAELVAIGA
ncbi:NAD(P)H dehydrogenase (Quinone) OS=Tsukamurella paurometabola (strain ATCC 8368 / DSM / CCUG 35730 / CIP 100753 / JCM 10117 / KCTC 9821 / NBRC 16120 / NCIMB 702349 / NCTC 13040) OX=521096 GN=Tpau_0697 PE=4 SV=1 [Tsukamurella paurometabola]|uniref:NAD(P)H dehydrogenase (Quinone) n=1 Tax=Tsukamurella paurometabola (strain ATCC 8368 / DSM 20162 / CCUG 35730 / CIP 100753 / JCM 10117 / KCTC 9821 / NBRC 16120 / NCIMB 702349 / NCTC 13040) TaxID=521096 RepID=D5UT47_TSUPD|nr:NAD(P)H-dependent oxidoreductase [Tsukamurella paurometabola]ADG77334.1 NAD(P)H dehydrogenase (quinone) [Tsukamurella paurometabola DSM 20162]SUP43521.1 FMN-dependent NADH-azoreductase [Tsukamurella paurometabola]